MSSIKFWILTFCLIIPFRRTSARSVTPKITCDAGRFELGQAASVTCFFHKDVRANKDGIVMTARFFDALNTTTDSNIVNCNPFDNGTLHCVKRSGFVLRNKNNVTDRITVDIPTFTEHHTGVYKCHVIDDPSPTEPCYLLSKASSYTPSSTSSDNRSYIAAVVFLVIVCLCILLCGLHKTRVLLNSVRRVFRWKKKHSPTNAKDNELVIEPLLTQGKSEEKSGDIVYTFPDSTDSIDDSSTVDETHHSQNQGLGSREPSLHPYFNASGMTRKPYEFKMGTGLDRTPSFIKSMVFPTDGGAQNKQD